MIRVGSDFSGVGSFEQALDRLGIEYDSVFACDMDKYARQSYTLHFGEPKYFPKDVYEREIPKESLDIYMTSPPCQAFSMAGKRLGKKDERGILFYNSLEFIEKNKPRYFIFENVKGLLSHDKKDKDNPIGRTFSEWLNCLGGKSINGRHTLFPYEDSVPYHIYWKVLNAKDFGVPQNRERVFIIGIRDDEDNFFTFPKEQFLEKRLKDVLEDEVDDKYYLSDTRIFTLNNSERSIGFTNLENKHIANCIIASYGKIPTDGEYLKVKSATSKGYEIAKVGEDSINFEHPNSNTRRGRVGVGVGQTLTTSCNQGVAIIGYTRDAKGKVVSRHEKDIAGTITTASGGGGNTDQFVKIGAIRGRNPDNPTSRESGLPTQQMLEINENGTSNCLTTVQKDNVVVENNLFNTNKSSMFNGNIKSSSNEERNTIKTLSLLQKEIGTKEVETWGLRILETIREKEILWKDLYEKSLYRKTKETSKGYNNKIQQSKSSTFIAQIIMRSLSEERWKRCSPQGRKSIKQLIRQLNESLSKLSHEDSQSETYLQSGELQYKSERIRLLRETLSKIQKIWESINGKTQSIHQNYRIRRLTPREAFRLMDFNPDMIENVIGSGEISDSQLYKQAGNSIVVGVLVELLKKILK